MVDFFLEFLMKHRRFFIISISFKCVGGILMNRAVYPSWEIVSWFRMGCRPVALCRGNRSSIAPPWLSSFMCEGWQGNPCSFRRPISFQETFRYYCRKSSSPFGSSSPLPAGIILPGSLEGGSVVSLNTDCDEMPVLPVAWTPVFFHMNPSSWFPVHSFVYSPDFYFITDLRACMLNKAKKL